MALLLRDVCSVHELMSSDSQQKKKNPASYKIYEYELSLCLDRIGFSSNESG